MVIVGGGPAGLASAIALESCGFQDITVVELRKKSSFDANKSYMYRLNGRGQR